MLDIVVETVSPVDQAIGGSGGKDGGLSVNNDVSTCVEVREVWFGLVWQCKPVGRWWLVKVNRSGSAKSTKCESSSQSPSPSSVRNLMFPCPCPRPRPEVSSAALPALAFLPSRATSWLTKSARGTGFRLGWAASRRESIVLWPREGGS